MLPVLCIGGREMIEVTTATAEDLDAVEPMEIFKQEVPFLWRLKSFLAMPNAVAHTFSVKGKVIGCIGAVMNNGDEMTIWAWLSPLIKKYPIDFSKKCLMALRYYIEQSKPERVIMYVRRGADDVVKWGNFLGFKKAVIVEGIDGCEYYKMVRAGDS